MSERTEYIYTDEAGRPIYKVVRGQDKRFRQVRINPDGTETSSKGCMKDVRRVPYRLPELREAIGSNQVIYVVEGEKDADRAVEEGLVATCNVGGAGEWKQEYAEHFRGHRGTVRVIADRDAPGYQHAEKVRSSLHQVGVKVVVLEAAEGKDLSDHLDAGHSIEDLVEINPEERIERRRASRPQIQQNDRQLDEVVDEFIAMMAAQNDPPQLFVRGDLVGLQRNTRGELRAVPVRGPALLDYLSSWADFHAGETAVPPRQNIASVAVARLIRLGGWLPKLHSIVGSPIIRSDGSLVAETGYDPETAIYYAPTEPVEVPNVPEAPTPRQVGRAIETLLEPLTDFPFRDEASRACAVAAILTLAVRHFIDGPVPAFLFDAPARGTGKSLLAEIIALIGTGGSAATMSPPGDRDDAEWRKRITAALLEGRLLQVIDNLEVPLGSSALAALLTTRVWRDRILGRSEIVDIPNDSVWIITGNNIRLGGDFPRRSVLCRLDAAVPQPWTRAAATFQHPDLVRWVRHHRGELLAAVVTIVRAWIQARRPGPESSVPTLGGYEAWRHVVAGMLKVAEVDGFLGNQQELYEKADDEAITWAPFLKELWLEFGRSRFQVRDIVHKIKQGDIEGPLPLGLPDPDEPGFANSLGHALRGIEGRRFVVGRYIYHVARAGQQGGAARWRAHRSQVDQGD